MAPQATRLLSTLRFYLMRNLLYAVCVLLLMTVITACTPESSLPDAMSSTATPESTRQSAWGSVITLAQTPQSDAPAMLATGSGVWLAWSQSDANGARHVLRLPENAPYSPAIDATHPFDYRWFPGGGMNDRGWQHLFWRDRHEGELLLQMTTIDKDDGEPVRMHTVSTNPTQYYTLASRGSRLTQIVYTEDFRQQTALYTRVLHTDGNLLSRSTLRTDATHPALVRTPDDTLWLYWLEATDTAENARRVYQGRLEQDDLSEVQPIGTLTLPDGATLQQLSAVMDDTHAYLFWQVHQADSSHAVWFSSGEPGSTGFSVPAELTFRVDESQSLDVPFNTDNVHSARLDGAAAPSFAGVPQSDERFEVLPVAFHTGNTLGVAYFDDGTLTGYQDMLRTGTLLRAPALSTTILNDIYLAWSEPEAGAPATLYLTTTVSSDG
jgi:hypothetical protein